MYSLVKDLYDTNEPNFIGAFLYGSQNYGLDTEESDKDIIILIKDNDKSHRQIKKSTGVIKIYTLKHFLVQLEKGDMECYEILYTKHRIINKKYENIFNNFVSEFTKVLNIDRIKWALGKKLFEHLSNISWIPFNRDDSKYHKKRAYWSYRVYDQLIRIINNEPLQDTFIYNVSKKEIGNMITHTPYFTKQLKTKTMKPFISKFQNHLLYNCSFLLYLYVYTT